MRLHIPCLRDVVYLLVTLNHPFDIGEQDFGWLVVDMTWLAQTLPFWTVRSHLCMTCVSTGSIVLHCVDMCVPCFGIYHCRCTILSTQSYLLCTHAHTWVYVYVCWVATLHTCTYSHSATRMIMFLFWNDVMRTIRNVAESGKEDDCEEWQVTPFIAWKEHWKVIKRVLKYV